MSFIVSISINPIIYHNDNFKKLCNDRNLSRVVNDFLKKYLSISENINIEEELLKLDSEQEIIDDKKRALLIIKEEHDRKSQEESERYVPARLYNDGGR